jgi:8-oxo-dGTP pyrophosphatase MutT (NUDIX family)
LVDDRGSGDRRVLMIAREKEPFRDQKEPVPRADALAFPGGSIEENESAVDAARRELFEETGYRAIGEPFASIVIEFTSRGTMVRIESFAFSRWTPPEGASELTPKWMTFDEALSSRLAPGMSKALVAFRDATELIAGQES